MQDLLLPLFPLEVVLFPGQRLPLHIFEDRYKKMIGECLAGEASKEFGVVLSKDNAIVNVGCTAEITGVTRQYPDGRMDITTLGRRRFEVLFVDESREYLRAAAQFFQDEDVKEPPPIAKQIKDLQHQVMQLIPHEEDEPAPEASLPLSFRVSGPLPLDLDFRQMLLALRSEPERLERLLEYLQQLLPRLRLASHARAKAGGNGQCR